MPLASRLTPQRIESSPTIGDSARPASKFLAATSCQVASSQPDGKCSGRRPPEAPRTSPSTACRNDSATIVGRVSCPRAIVKIVFTSRLEWLFRHFSGMQAFGTVYHRKCQNVLGFLLTLPVANVQCRFSERRKSVSPEFLDSLAKPSCLASLNGYFLRPPLFHRAVFPERSSRTSGGNRTCACFLVRARGEFRDVQKSVRYGHHVRCATSNILT